MKSRNVQREIESCLAYEVMRDPDGWLGNPSTIYLRAFLAGTEMRTACVQPGLPHWRIYGVLNDVEFYEPLVTATGHPKLTIKWATAIALTHFSLAEGLTHLRDLAVAWHADHGVAESHSANRWEPLRKSDSTEQRANRFWSEFARRPIMYMGDGAGWTLYCFLAGMNRGGDWLNLPVMPRLSTILERIGSNSEESYGSDFAAYRLYDAQALLEWCDLGSIDDGL